MPASPTTHLDRLPHAGPNHPRIKQLLGVRRNRGPARGVALALESTWALRVALQHDAVIETAFVCPELVRGDETVQLVCELRRRRVPVFAVSARVLGRMVERDGPDGIAALGRPREHTLADITVGSRTRLVVADRFELAGNLGTLIRCADGAGASAVLVTDRRVRLGHPLVLKASMGTLFAVPVVTVSGAEARRWLHEQGVRIAAADPAAGTPYRHADMRGPIAIVLGSERNGLDPAWRAAAELRLSIPMLGVADSLNVGHAAALLLYEALAQEQG